MNATLALSSYEVTSAFLRKDNIAYVEQYRVPCDNYEFIESLFKNHPKVKGFEIIRPTASMQKEIDEIGELIEKRYSK